MNFAAQGEGAASWVDSWRFFETNAVALVRLVEEIAKGDYLKRFIHIGTSELYGSVDRPVTEDAPIRPSSPYAASKAAFDLHLMAIAKVKGFPMNIIRPSNCYGPGQLLHRIIPRAIVAGLKGERIPLHGGGAAHKSYIHSKDLASAIHIVATRAPLGEVYNVGPRVPTAISALMVNVAYELGKRIEDLCEVSEDRAGQDACYWLDSAKIERLGWEPKIKQPIGLRDVIAWARQHFDILKDWPTTYTVRP